jgi:single-stranded-DNA-specific exonuclease
VTSTALLVMALRMLKADVRPYIPKRLDEGYGLNTPALIELARRGIRLVITVDCGIRSVQEVEDGKAAGLDIIVTDHHSLGPEIPDAYAVINPKQDGEDPLMWAGVGVAYCLASALFRAEYMNSRNGRSAPQTPDALIDLVAIGTVADLMACARCWMWPGCSRAASRRRRSALRSAPGSTPLAVWTMRCWPIIC